jgi:hypothetical protein
MSSPNNINNQKYIVVTMCYSKTDAIFRHGLSSRGHVLSRNRLVSVIRCVSMWGSYVVEPIRRSDWSRQALSKRPHSEHFFFCTLGRKCPVSETFFRKSLKSVKRPAFWRVVFSLPVFFSRIYRTYRYPYFGLVAGLVWSDDPESYAGGSVWYW